MTPRFHDPEPEMDPGQALALRQFAVALFRLVASYRDLERHRLTTADVASWLGSGPELHPSLGARSLRKVVEDLNTTVAILFPTVGPLRNPGKTDNPDRCDPYIPF